MSYKLTVCITETLERVIEVDIDEIYYKRQDLENYFTQLVDSERR